MNVLYAWDLRKQIKNKDLATRRLRPMPGKLEFSQFGWANFMFGRPDL